MNTVAGIAGVLLIVLFAANAYWLNEGPRWIEWLERRRSR